MDDMTAVRRAVDRLLGGDPGPMLDLLAEDVAFEVVGGGESPENRRDSGKRAVAEHCAALGELVAFWQIDYGAVDGQVIAWGKESFTGRGAVSRERASSRWCSISREAGSLDSG